MRKRGQKSGMQLKTAERMETEKMVEDEFHANS